MAIKFYDQWYDVFNNFSAHQIEFEGEMYPTSEHAYQAAKCLDDNSKLQIKAAKSPLLAKHVCNETYRDWRDPDWDDKKLIIMEAILRAKLAQHQEVRDALQKSGTQEIVEDSPEDSFWGCGADGNGDNYLGKLWMKIRAEMP